MLTVTDSLPSTLPAPVQDPLLITGTGFTTSRREALRVSPAGGALQRNIVLASAAAAAPEGDWHHDGAGDQRESE